MADYLGNRFRAVDAVLEAEHGRARTQHRANQRKCGRIVVCLDGNDHHIHEAHFVGVRLCRGTHDEVTQRRTSNLEAVLADGIQVRASSYERDVVAGPRQLCAVIAADGAGPKNRELHRYPPSLVAFPRRIG